MMNDMGDAMRRALQAVRSQDPMQATREIQAALTGKAAPEARPEVEVSTPTRGRTSPPRRAEAEIEDAEIVGEPDAAEKPLFEKLAERLKAGGLDLGKLPLRPNAPGPALEIPPGAQYLSRSHSGPEGARDYKLYIPSCGTGRLRGLVVMLHGCTQTPDDFARGTRMNAAAEAAGLAVAWPAQPQAANMQSCWNWFEAGHQTAARGEPAIIAALTRSLRDEFGIDHDRVFVAGLSAGGAMAAILGETHPELFAAIGVHSGLPAGAAQDMVSAFAAMQGRGGGRAAARSGPRLFVFHGDADRTVDVSNAQRIIGAGSDGHKTGRSPGGRGYRRSLHGGPEGQARAECWIVEGAGHAWSGGSGDGSYTDPTGPDASAEMLRFFLETRG